MFKIKKKIFFICTMCIITWTRSARMRFERELLNGFDHKARVLILVEEFSGWPSSSLSTKSTTNTTHVCPAFRTNFRPDTVAWAVLENVW